MFGDVSRTQYEIVYLRFHFNVHCRHRQQLCSEMSPQSVHGRRRQHLSEISSHSDTHHLFAITFKFLCRRHQQLCLVTFFSPNVPCRRCPQVCLAIFQTVVLMSFAAIAWIFNASAVSSALASFYQVEDHSAGSQPANAG